MDFWEFCSVARGASWDFCKWSISTFEADQLFCKVRGIPYVRKTLGMVVYAAALMLEKSRFFSSPKRQLADSFHKCPALSATVNSIRVNA